MIAVRSWHLPQVIHDCRPDESSYEIDERQLRLCALPLPRWGQFEFGLTVRDEDQTARHHKPQFHLLLHRHIRSTRLLTVKRDLSFKHKSGKVENAGKAHTLQASSS